MSISIAESRQHLSALIAAAQLQPQVITNRNKPVAVLVSADYFDVICRLILFFAAPRFHAR